MVQSCFERHQTSRIYEETTMFTTSRRRKSDPGVRYCDACAEVTTATQRAQRRHEQTRDRAMAWTMSR
jgi:hypothetical protein